ncbi:MASE3 domain-containing protein [uncultured Azohydromonas sp.]|uniref:MASE3 domain-containing protein n=1 Tax=uncultured Azohydromonas sp. TaxID=487342 RepID=UPI002614FA1F|nr:MASE3 domain-containing protein [uncultured Azohydromonas sp.]
MALSKVRQWVFPLILGLLLLGVQAWNPAWFHALADLLPLMLGGAMFLAASQAFGLARHAFVLCVASGFFWASVLDILHLVLQERMLDLGEFPPDASVQLWLGARLLQALALMLAPFCAGKSSVERAGFLLPGLGTLLMVALVRAQALGPMLIAGAFFSPLKIVCEWLLVAFYAGAAVLIHQRRRLLDAALRRTMLTIVLLLALGELCHSMPAAPQSLFGVAAHLFKLWSFCLLLGVVHQHLLLQPRRLLRQQAQLLADITSQVPGLAWQLQRQPSGRLRFTFASTGTAEIFELTMQELLDDARLGFSRIVPRDREQLLAAIERSGQTLTPWKVEWQAVLPRKGRRWHRGESSMPVVEADGSCLWVGHIQDITDEKLVDLELARHRDHLAALVQERTEALHQAMLQTEQAARSRTEFLSNMSHEIRTPLNAILGVSQIALRDAQAVPARPWLRQIHESGRLLLALVNDILDMAKVEAGRLELESRPVRLSAVVQRAMRLMAPRAQQQRLDFGVECGPELPEGVLADETRLTQVLVNLLGNAIKFTEHGSVRLTVSRLPVPGRVWLMFAVRDTGIGMSPEQVGQLFQPFVQADASTTRRFGGTGLGLSIAKRIVDLMGGSIEVSSQRGRGSCFALRIPFDEASAPAEEHAGPAGPAAEGGRLQGLRILAAEDDAVNQWVLRELLEQEGAGCRITDNGLEALTVLETGEEFDLFLTDVQMPGLNGYDTARRCRALRPALPIVGLTAYALPQERRRCLEAGMDDHVTKPVDMDQLCAAILRLAGGVSSAAAAVAPPAPVAVPASAPVPDAAPGAAPVLDWPALWQRLRRPSAVQRLLQTLLAEHEPTPRRLRACADAGDAEEAARLAHQLRGVGATVFAAPLREAARRLESHLHDEGGLDPAQLLALAQATEALLQAARDGLAGLDGTRIHDGGEASRHAYR